MDEKFVKARFLPEATALNQRRSDKTLLIENTPPKISLALSKAYPAILLLNRLLSIISWTDEDPYYIICLITFCGIIIIYWEFFSHFVLSIILCFVACSLVWLTKTSVQSLGETSESPTLEEIIDSLRNLNTRISFLSSGLRLSKSQISRLEVLGILLIPLQCFLVRRILGIRHFALLIMLFSLTFYSTWAVTFRKLIWRNVAVQKIVNLVIGPSITTAAAKTIPSASKIDISKGANIVTFEIYEHQRRWVGIGWSNRLLPFERTHLTNEYLEECCSSLNNFTFPKLTKQQKLQGCRWKWMEEKWKIDEEYCKHHDSEGWVYYDNKWENGVYKDTVSSFTRTRKLYRRALVVHKS